MKIQPINERWEYYCKASYNSLKSNLYLWKNPTFYRPITRIFYTAVYDCGKIAKTGLISLNAIKNKEENKKTVEDHFLAPQFVGRMILDNYDSYLVDYEKYKEIFLESCKTITVTKEENIKLSSLTKNANNNFYIKVPSDKKYKHLNISLYKKNQESNGEIEYKLATDDMKIPEELLKYEKKFLVK
jgi:hypothetical protein